MEQQELIQKIKSGDEVAFEKLFRLFYQSLCSYAHSFISDMDVAEEIVQDILVKLWLVFGKLTSRTLQIV